MKHRLRSARLAIGVDGALFFLLTQVVVEAGSHGDAVSSEAVTGRRWISPHQAGGH
jgi:hypothetical protein